MRHVRRCLNFSNLMIYLACQLPLEFLILLKITDFHDGALLARRPDLCKSLYFLRKSNDFQECALFARRFARSMSISVPCAPHEAGLRRSEAPLEKKQ